MFEGSIVMLLVEIKWCKAILLRSQWRFNGVRLYFNVPGRDKMLYGSNVTFMVEITCCKPIKLRSQWRSNDVWLYCNVPGRDQMM